MARDNPLHTVCLYGLVQFTSSLSVQASLPLDAEGLVGLVQQVQAWPEGAGGPAAGQGGGGAGAGGWCQRRAAVLAVQAGACTQKVLLHAGHDVRQWGRDPQAGLWGHKNTFILRQSQR